MRTIRQGFTLVEVAIVLVIIGLVVGGVLAGQSLIRSAQLNAIGKERAAFETAVFAFKEKYLAWPGDMPNAYDFWGDACGTNTTTPSTGCNGDGDGNIELAENGEDVKAWEHLSRAELIQGNYDGTGTVSGGAVELTSSNMVESRFPQGYWRVSSNPGDVDALTSVPVISTGAVWLQWGAVGTPAYTGELGQHPTLTNGEALQLDTKIDDGRASTGSMRGDNRGDCVDNGTDYYSLQAVGPDNPGACALHFMISSNSV